MNLLHEQFKTSYAAEKNKLLIIECRQFLSTAQLKRGLWVIAKDRNSYKSIMRKDRKLIKYIAVGIIGVIIVVVAVKLVINNTYRTQIPPLPDIQAQSEKLKEQLTESYNKAYRNPSAYNLGMMGMVYHSSAYYGEAELFYKLASEKNNAEWIWSYYLGYLKHEMGEPSSALENFRSVITKDPQNYQAWYYLGESYQKIGALDSAEVAFKTIINRRDRNVVIRRGNRYDYFPLVSYAMYNLARIYNDTKRIDLAEEILNEIINYQKTFGPAYRLLGNVHNIKGNKTLSDYYLVRANDLTGNPLPVDTLIDNLSLMSRSDVYLLKKIDEAQQSFYPEFAVELVNHALNSIPENNYIISKAIKLFLARDMVNQTLPYLDQHINYFQKDFDELKSVGDLLYNKRSYSRAMDYYSKAIKLKPEDSKIQSNMVLSLSKEGKKEQALDLVNEMLEKNKTNPPALADGVSVLLIMGEKETALPWLSKLMRLSPSNPKGLQLSGMLAEQEGNWQKALTMYELSFKGDQEDLITVRLISNLLIRQNMWEKAIIYLRKVLELNPNEPFLLEKLGTLLVMCPNPKLRNLEDGKDLCERAFINNNSEVLTIISAGRSMAIAYAELNDKQNARNILNMTIDLLRKENLPSDYITNLEILLQQINASN